MFSYVREKLYNISYGAFPGFCPWMNSGLGFKSRSIPREIQKLMRLVGRRKLGDLPCNFYCEALKASAAVNMGGIRGLYKKNVAVA